MTSRTICITLLASEWKSSKGGLSTMNRELAIQLAMLSNTSVSFFVPKCNCCEEDRREAKERKVKIVEADKRTGYDPIDWLTFPPKDLAIDFVVGHGVKLGKQAQIIRDSHQCKWMQVVHTAPDELSMFKNYSGAIPKGEEKQWDELELCKMADLCVAVGPKLTEIYTAYLNFCGQKVCNFTPGIFDQLSSIQPSLPTGRKFRVLVFGRGDTEDFELKGYDIAAKAVALLEDKTYHLTFVGASKGSESHVIEELLKHGLFRSQLIVKRYLENREGLMTLLCASNLVIIPSRTEGFGLTALEALSAGVPFLVSQNSGFGEALQEIGSAFIVDSEDPEDWAEAIKAARQKGSETAFQECRELRTRYSEKYSWQTQCKGLFRMMRSLIHEIDDPNKKQTSEYQPRQNIQQESSIRFSGTVAKSATPRTSEIFTSLPERHATKESVERPIMEVPEKSTATPTSQGARPKESNSVTPESGESRGSNKRDVYTEKEDAQSGKAGESTQSRNVEQWETTQRRKEVDAPKPDSLSLANKPTASDPFSGASRRREKKENKPLDTEKEGWSPRMGQSDPVSGTDPLQRDTSANFSLRGYESVYTEKEGSSRRMRESDPLSGIDREQSASFKKAAPGGCAAHHDHVASRLQDLPLLKTNQSEKKGLSTPTPSGQRNQPDDRISHTRDQGARPKEKIIEAPRQTPLKDLAVLGCNVSGTFMDAVKKEIEKILPRLNKNPDVGNFPLAGVKQFLEGNPLRFCVLVVDSNTVGDVRETFSTDALKEYKDLLEMTVERVDEKVIVLVCCDLPQRLQSEMDACYTYIGGLVKARNKGFTVWLTHGKDISDSDFFKDILISEMPQTDHSERFHGQPNIPPATNTALFQTYEAQRGGYHMEQSSGIQEFGKQFQQTQPNPTFQTPHTEYTVHRSSRPERVMLKSKLRYGEISFCRGDLEFIHPYWKVPEYVTEELNHDFWATRNCDLLVLSDDEGNLRYIVDVGLGTRLEGFFKRTFSKLNTGRNFSV